MYENGEPINRYANKQIHKRRLKEKAAKQFWWNSNDSWANVVEYERQKMIACELMGFHYTPSKYWQEHYLSEIRGFAKEQSHTQSRRRWRQDVKNKDYDDIGYAQEDKYFDYDWTIW